MIWVAKSISHQTRWPEYGRAAGPVKAGLRSDQQPTEKKTDELDEKQLDKIGGGSGAAVAPHGPAPPPRRGHAFSIMSTLDATQFHHH